MNNNLEQIARKMAQILFAKWQKMSNGNGNGGNGHGRNDAPKIEKRYLTVRELSVFSGLSEIAIYRKVAKGELPVIRMGRKIMFDKVAIIRKMEESSI